MEKPNNQINQDDQIEETINIKISRNAKEIFHYSIIILFGIVLLQNTQKVDFNFLFWEFSISKIIILPIYFFLGYLFIRLHVFSFIGKNKK